MEEPAGTKHLQASSFHEGQSARGGIAAPMLKQSIVVGEERLPRWDAHQYARAQGEAIVHDGLQEARVVVDVLQDVEEERKVVASIRRGRHEMERWMARRAGG